MLLSSSQPLTSTLRAVAGAFLVELVLPVVFGVDFVAAVVGVCFVAAVACVFVATVVVVCFVAAVATLGVEEYVSSELLLSLSASSPFLIDASSIVFLTYKQIYCLSMRSYVCRMKKFK